MNNLISFILMTLFINCNYVLASNVSANITGEQFSWDSASITPQGVLPSLWDIPALLPPASQVILGGPTSVAEQTINISGPDGKSISLPITVKGVQYRLSSYSNNESISDGTSTAEINGLENTVIGSGISNVMIHLSKTESPFTHVRPVLAPINTDSWINAFKIAKASNGHYNGSLIINVPYDYYRGGVRIRNTLAIPITLSINYTSQILNNVVITGTDSMVTTYHYPLLVSGETTYTVTSTGYFTNGIWMGLVPPSNGENYYSLSSSNPNNTDEIKYNVTCISGCDGANNQIIINGVPQINNTTKRVKILGTNTTQSIARLKVDFNRIPIVSNDTYTGKIILTFEVNI
ncbi:TPA: hypothetical protein ACX6SV_003154 [Photobacterium damselae]